MNGLHNSTAVILAAGLGTRMRSDLAKVRHKVLDLPLVVHVIRAAQKAGVGRIVVVVGHQADSVKADIHAHCPVGNIEFALQASPNGTGHAVLMAKEATAGAEKLLILNGDVPGIEADTLEALAMVHEHSASPLALATAEITNPTGYGRMVRSENGDLLDIVEEKDATEDQRGIHEVNVGLYLVDREFLYEALADATPANAQGEIYLTHVVPFATARGTNGETLLLEEGPEMWGINTRVELARVESEMRRAVIHRHQSQGVTIPFPETVEIGPDVVIGRDTLIRRGCRLQGQTRLGSHCTVDEGAVVLHSQVGDGAHIKPYCMLDSACLGDGVAVGPFAHLRPGTRLDDNVKVGNFVETKKAHLKAGAKASHLSYLGDCEVGEASNIGAGTITCNYDGVNKFKTTLGKEVFIGSDTQLVAPVEVGDGAFVAAGTTVTSNVPAGALAISRADQRNIEGWVKRKKARQQKKS